MPLVGHSPFERCYINAQLLTLSSSICWDGLSMGEISEILEDFTGCVPKIAEACKGVVPRMLEGVLGEESKI